MTRASRLKGYRVSKTKSVRYVRHHDVETYKAKGWVVSDDLQGTHHGAYSQILVWPHEGEPE